MAFRHAIVGRGHRARANIRHAPCPDQPRASSRLVKGEQRPAVRGPPPGIDRHHPNHRPEARLRAATKKILRGNMSYNKLLLFSAVAATALSASLDANAQEAKPQRSSNSVMEVIVTAQRRSERLHDVPLSVTAL